MPSDLSPSNSLTEALQLDVGSSSQHCSRPILPNVFRCSIPPTWVVGPMPHAPCPIACMCLSGFLPLLDCWYFAPLVEAYTLCFQQIHQARNSATWWLCCV